MSMRNNSMETESQRTVVKHITPKVVGHNLSKNIQSSLLGLSWPHYQANYNTPATTTSIGLASLAQTSSFTTISAIHSINGERIIDEIRELSKLTEILGNVILQCCSLEAHIHAQQLQLEWLQTHQHENSSVVQKFYQTEIDRTRKLLAGKQTLRLDIETKLQESQRALGNDERIYQQLLKKRNDNDEELFNLERQIAQNNGEAQFLQRRFRYLDEESKFYLLKNQGLHSRKTRLRYELDEQTFAVEGLKLEHEILRNEKITQEDVHANALDEAQNAVDISQVGTMQASKTYQEQLNIELQRIRSEYEKKIEVVREELHRQFELVLHRYFIQKTQTGPTVSKEHQLKLEQYIKEKQETSQQVAAVRGQIDEITAQIQMMERQIFQEKNSENSTMNMKKKLAVLNQMTDERERQLQEAMRNRAILKQHIDNYRDQLNRHPKVSGQISSAKRLSVPDFNQSGLAIAIDSKNRLSVDESMFSNRENNQFDEQTEQGTLTSFANFNVNQDCEELHRLLIDLNIDEVGIIRILCNRTLNQRLLIRDKYRSLFNRNLGETMEIVGNHSLNKILRILLLSPVDHDCYELRRILRGANLDETILVEVLFTRTKRHIQAVKETYQQLFHRDLEQDIIGERETQSKRILLILLRSQRPDDQEFDDNSAYKDARNLFETGAPWRTEESTFLRLLCTRSNAQLKQIFAMYYQFNNIDIEEAIKIHVNGSLYYTYMAIIRIIRNRPRFFAYELKKSLKGATTNEDNLNRIIVSRCEIDMAQIKSEYEKIAKRSLYTHIQTDLSGNYKLALLELLRQRIDFNTRDSIFRQFQQNGASLRISKTDRRTVQWRQPAQNDSTISNRTPPLTRSLSDRHINEDRRPENYQREIKRSNNDSNDRDIRIATNNLFPMNTTSTKLQSGIRRTFIPMPTMEENVFTSDHTEN